MAMPQISATEQAKLQMMQEMEIEMMSDLYNRMTNACHKKCIPPRYGEAELGKHLSMISVYQCHLLNVLLLNLQIMTIS